MKSEYGPLQKYIEYWIWRGDERDGADLDTLEGKDWRMAKALIANPETDIVVIERVTSYGNDAAGIVDREYETLYERDDSCADCTALSRK